MDIDKDALHKDTKDNIQYIDSLLSKKERIILALHDRNLISYFGYYIDYIDEKYISLYPQIDPGMFYKFMLSEIPDSFLDIQDFFLETIKDKF